MAVEWSRRTTASGLPRHWGVALLGDCGKWYSGGTPNTKIADYWNGDIPWITASSLHDFHIRDSERRVTELGLENGTRLVPENSILFVVRGMSLKSEFRVGIAKRPVAFGQDCKAIVVRSGIEPCFLANFLRAKAADILGLVDEASHGTGRLQTGTLSDLEVPIPPLPEQRAIAHILGTLDDKIELNRWMNETLEAMARAFFKWWFVDFDPVRAKAEGRNPGLPKEIADLFPAEFQESGLGRIPKGWAVRKMADLAKLSKNTVKPGDHPDETFAHYSIPAYDEGRTPKADKGESIKSSKYLISKRSVLLSKLNPRFPRVWLPMLEQDRRAIASTEFLDLRPVSGMSREFLYSLFSSQAFLDIFTTLVTGTSGSHQRVKPDFLKSMEVLQPSPELVAAFTRNVRPVLQRTAQNTVEGTTLASIRDALLPRLLSGEIRVGNVDEFVESSR